MRKIAIIALCLSTIGLLMAGCAKQTVTTELAAGAPKGSAKPAPPLPVADAATAQEKTVPGPGGSELRLVSGADPKPFAEAGVPAYPGASAWSVTEGTGAESADSRADSVRQIVFETADPLEKVAEWAKTKLSGWEVTPIEEAGGIAQFSASSPGGPVELRAFDAPSEGKRYISVADVRGMLTTGADQVESAQGAAAPKEAPRG